MYFTPPPLPSLVPSTPVTDNQWGQPILELVGSISALMILYLWRGAGGALEVNWITATF